ncbi:MAG: tetratricopeptide repeat protein, partial [Deltaproteobacteria bacterium]
MRARSWRFGVWMAVAAALGCSAQAPPGPSATHGDLAASLVELGQAALARGELAEAENRFERALRAQPASAPARVGLGRVAAARGQSQEAEERFQEALELDPGSVDAHLGLGRLQAGAGRPALARAALSRAVALDPWRAEAHAELAALTGLAPRAPVSGAEAALRVAQDHPYDVWAGLRAARALALAGRAPKAIEQLQGVVWLADRDPASGRAALELLGRLDPAWRGRPVVPVHCWADDGIRARPGWRFRLRLAWLGITETFRETLAVRFVPFSLGAFSSQAARPELDAILAAFRSQSRGAPRHGILAGFTDRAPARRPGRYERGLAE